MSYATYVHYEKKGFFNNIIISIHFALFFNSKNYVKATNIIKIKPFVLNLNYTYISKLILLKSF